VLVQCASIVYLDLSCNDLGPDGGESLAGVLVQCSALTHLDLCWNQIGDSRSESFAEVLGQCRTLTHLNLGWGRNHIVSTPVRSITMLCLN